LIPAEILTIPVQLHVR